MFTWTAVRIGESQHFKFFGELFDRGPQIAYFLAAIDRVSCNHDIGLDARTLHYAFDDASCGVFLGSEDEKNLVILPLKFCQCDEVALEPRLDSFARAQQSHARRVESRIGMQLPAHVTKPLHTLPNKIRSEQNLNGYQQIKERVHFLKE